MKKVLKFLLKFLRIIDEKIDPDRIDPFIRFNPYNPLSYILLLILLPLGLLESFLYAFIQFFEDIGGNPFKWR